MQQILHLLIVDYDKATALATWHRSRWLLPVLTCAERVRADPAVLRWVSQRAVKSELVGRWLGRIAPNATDWLMVISSESQRFEPPPPQAWTPLEALSMTMALIEYQGWAVTQSIERDARPSVPGSFGHFKWIEEVKAWIGASVGSTPSALTPYRVTAHEVVLGADTSRGRVYFKGLTDQRAAEPRVTQALATLAPSSFARTLAYDARSDGSVWWLTAGCRGTAAADAALVAAALARLQQSAMASAPSLRALPLVNLWVAARWASELVDDSACAVTIERALERVAIASVPDSWIPMDLDPTNVLVDGSDVQFIDLDDSFLGPAPLAMAIFVKRCRDRSLYRVYEQAWSTPLADVDWPAFEIAAIVFEAWLGWQRVKRNTERGEVYGALDLAMERIRERLLRACEAGEPRSERSERLPRGAAGAESYVHRR